MDKEATEQYRHNALKPIGPHTPVAAAAKTCTPATLGIGQMAPAITTEDKATFSEVPVKKI